MGVVMDHHSISDVSESNVHLAVVSVDLSLSLVGKPNLLQLLGSYILARSHPAAEV